jgi:hypothetical protein
MNEAVANTADATASGSPKIERLFAAAGATAIISGSAAVWYFDPKTAGFFPVCPLYSLTGFACPGCGLTRGFHALFHGDILTALDYNAMLPFFGTLIAFALFSMIAFAIRGTRPRVNLLHPNALWVFFIMLMVFGVARNLPWYPFTILFP